MKKQTGFLLGNIQQMNRGAVVSGVGFLLYLGATVLGWTAAADILALTFSIVSLYVFASVAAGRRRDKEAVSYNLLWGQAALALLTCMCGVLTLRELLLG